MISIQWVIREVEGMPTCVSGCIELPVKQMRSPTHLPVDRYAEKGFAPAKGMGLDAEAVEVCQSVQHGTKWLTLVACL